LLGRIAIAPYKLEKMIVGAILLTGTDIVEYESESISVKGLHEFKLSLKSSNCFDKKAGDVVFTFNSPVKLFSPAKR